MKSLIFTSEGNSQLIQKKINLANYIRVCVIPNELLLDYKINNTVYAEVNEDNNCSYNELKKFLIKNKVNVDRVIFVLPNNILKAVTMLLKNDELSSYYMVTEHDLKKKDSITEDDFIFIQVGLPRLRMLQLNLANHCNLNCKGCANYSNIERRPSFYDFAVFENDLCQLKKFFWGIEKLKLMGGEPLLNKDIASYLKIARELFPDALIEIGTNGLLIRQQEKLLFDTMKEYNIRFVISIYPGTSNHQNEIEKLLMDEGVEYQIYKFKGDFMKYMSEKPVWDKQEGYKHCPSRECHCLENGWLAICGRPLYIHRLNDKFKMNIPDDCGKWNLYETTIDPWKLDQLLRTPITTCQYCGPRQYFRWTISDKNSEKKDWIISCSPI